MKTVITYQGKKFTEIDNTNVKLIKARCKCGNELIIPLACAVLRIVKSCNHCHVSYPQHNHCAAITESYKDLIEGETTVSLD